ncbi:MAG: archease [Carbonactinosporaceae bacterium]
MHGHRRLPHTADVRIEAWASTREQCLAEAVVGFVESFVDLSESPRERADRTRRVDLTEEADEDVLVAVLNEVIYLMETAGEIPVSADAERAGGQVRVWLHLLPVDTVELTGAVPKAVSLHELRFAPAAPGWACQVTIDV